MAKDPCVLWYTSDFLTGTSHMTNEEVGVYTRLLAHQHQQKRLSLEFIKRITGKKFDKIWPHIKDKFLEDEEGYYNERMDLESWRRQKFSDKQKEKAALSWQSRGKATASAQLKPIMGNTYSEKEKEIEKGFEEEGPGGTDTKWNHMPSADDVGDVPELTVNAAIQLLLITRKLVVTVDQVTDIWEVFKVQSLTGKKFYANIGDVYSHFINWIKKQEFTDGNNGKQSSASSRKSQGFNDLLGETKNLVNATRG